MPIDIKTQTRTGVGGIVSMPPSPNKKWVHEFGPFVALPIPAEFVAYFEGLRGGRNMLSSASVGTGAVKAAADPEDFERAAELAELLSPARAEGYATWVDVGICLHNIDEGLLGAWCEFSKKSSKYDENVCVEKWAGFTQCILGAVGALRPLGFGSLVMWARKDDPEGYIGLQCSWHQPVVTDDDAMATARTLLEGLGQDPAKLVAVKSARVENGKLIVEVVCDDAEPVLQLDLTSLRVMSTINGVVVSVNYMHAAEAVDAKGPYDLATVQKDIRTGQLWCLRRPTDNHAVFSTHDQLSHIDMLNMDAPGGQVANVRLDGHKPTRVTAKKEIAVLQSMYNSSVQHALVDRYRMGCWINGDNNQVINVYTPPMQDERDGQDH